MMFLNENFIIQSKAAAREELFTSGTAIAKQAFDDVMDNCGLGSPAVAGVPSIDNLSRVVNRTRQHMRPKDPIGLDFEVS